MVKFVVSSDIQIIINEYNKITNLSEGDEGYISPETASLDHIQLDHVASTLQRKAEPAKKSRYSLSHILTTTSLYIEPIQKHKPVRPNLAVLMSESGVPRENGSTSTVS